jgi:polyisoprenoid-binding protein YceI
MEGGGTVQPLHQTTQPDTITPKIVLYFTITRGSVKHTPEILEGVSLTTTSAVTATDLLVRSTGKWTLDPNQSRIDVAHRTLWGLVKVKGRFAGLDGHGHVDPDGFVSGSLSIEAASIDTGNKKRDDHLRSEDFFKVRTNPHITFEADTIQAEATGLLVEGVLTAGGVSRLLRVPVVIRDTTEDAVTLEADVEIDRRDHGMTFNQMGMIRGETKVHATVRFVHTGVDDG